jgi:hypothetical protein
MSTARAKNWKSTLTTKYDVARALVRAASRLVSTLVGLFGNRYLRLGPVASPLQLEYEWFQNGSMNITLKNVPDSVYRVIKQEAKRKRRSLNSEIIQALEAEAAEAERRRQLSKLRKELDKFAASLPPLDDSAPLIRADRER